VRLEAQAPPPAPSKPKGRTLNPFGGEGPVAGRLLQLTKTKEKKDKRKKKGRVGGPQGTGEEEEEEEEEESRGEGQRLDGRGRRLEMNGSHVWTEFDYNVCKTPLNLLLLMSCICSHFGLKC